jgi:hypothetical protein
MQAFRSMPVALSQRNGTDHLDRAGARRHQERRVRSEAGVFGGSDWCVAAYLLLAKEEWVTLLRCGCLGCGCHHPL